MKILIICALLGAAFASTEIGLEKMGKAAHIMKNFEANFESLSERKKIESTNELADAVMQEVSNLMIELLGMDPMPMPDIIKSFSYKPIIITYHGELSLTKGWLQDLSTLHRNGDVTVDYQDRVLTANIPMAFTDFVFNYRYKAKIMGLGPSGEMDGKVSDVKVFTSIKVDFANLVVTLNRFDIEKIGPIKIKWHGNILVDWLANILTGLTTTIFKGLIKNIAENIVEGNLQKLIDLINIIFSNIKNPVMGSALGFVYKLA